VGVGLLAKSKLRRKVHFSIHNSPRLYLRRGLFDAGSESYAINLIMNKTASTHMVTLISLARPAKSLMNT
jgi:hypothetical protein